MAGLTTNLFSPTTAHVSLSLFKHEVYSDYRVKRMNSNERFSIGELSKATGVKVVTIRYYEHVNLMPAPPRTRANYRVYSREHLHRLQFRPALPGPGFHARPTPGSSASLGSVTHEMFGH